MMLSSWIKDETYQGMTDKIMSIIYKLRITDKQTLAIVTGWTDNQIRYALYGIRKMGDNWLRTWQPTHRSKYVYTLGEKGIEHVKALKDDALGYEESELTIKGQIGHFMGTNKILTRVLEANITIENFYSQKDTMSYLFYQMRPRESPVRPDGMIKFSEEYSCFLEFDNDTENGGRIEGKIHRYMMLSVMIGRILPIVWVTTKPSRVELIAKKAKQAPITYLFKMEKEIKKRKLPMKLPDHMPIMYAFTEGEEIPYFNGFYKPQSILVLEDDT